VVVQQGTTVDFKNDDNVGHNVYWPAVHHDKKLAHNMGTWPQGQSKPFTFTEVGDVPLLCNVHPEMSGYIFVVPTPYFAVTDKEGNFVIKNVPPGIYEGLTARVFDTPYYVFATSGYIGSAKYQLEPDQTFFAPNSNLFKSDLKLITPKAGAKVSADNLEIKWDSYPDAAYYKFSIYADESTGAKADYDDINKRVDGTSYLLDKPLSAGSYRIVVTAYNTDDIKIADSPDDIKFTVTGH